MGMWSDLLGTTESYLRLGKTGPRLKDSSGNLSIRNSGDSADVALTVLDEAYSSSWNGSLQVPTKNAVYDKIESLATFSNLNLNPGGRLTLASGDPYYNPNNTVAVSGQDTSADTITVTAHGWSVGTMVTSSATSGGITAATTYYVGNPTTNTVSLHTTLANAIAGTSKLDITGTVTANITAFGVANQTIYYTPAVHNQISLWDGSAWTVYSFTELSLALGTVTTSIGYDIFAYISGGAVAIEQLAWTSATARATAVTLQDGRWCKSGDKTRLLLGSYYSRDTTSTESSRQNRLVCNIYNQYQMDLQKAIITANWAYTTATWRQCNNSTDNQVAYFDSIGKSIPNITYLILDSNSGTNITTRTSIGIDSTTSPSTFNTLTLAIGGGGKQHITSLCRNLGIGYHKLCMLEYSDASGTTTWYGADFKSGIEGNISC